MDQPCSSRAEREREKELEAMKELYMGSNKEDAQGRKEAAADLYDTFDMRVDRHWSEKKPEEMTERDWRIFSEDYNISYKGSKITRPMRSWAESRLSLELLKAVEKAGYKTPSPIQMAAIPLALQQRDVIAVAGRGIDIPPHVDYVINYDMPGKIETYTHRVGRAGPAGVATTFPTLLDMNVFYDLKQMLIQSNSPVPPELAKHVASKFKPGTIPDRPPGRNLFLRTRERL